MKSLNDSLLIATFSFDKDGLQGKGFAVLNALNMQPLKVWHIPEARSLSIQPIDDTTFYLVVTKTLSSGGGITVIKSRLSGKIYHSYNVNMFGNERVKNVWIDTFGGLWLHFTDYDTLLNQRTDFIYNHYPDQKEFTNRCCNVEVDTQVTFVPILWQNVSFDTILSVVDKNMGLNIYINRNISGALYNTQIPPFWTCGKLRYYEPVYSPSLPRQNAPHSLWLYTKGSEVYILSEEILSCMVTVYSLEGRKLLSQSCESTQICKVNIPTAHTGLLLLVVRFEDGDSKAYMLLKKNAR